MLQRAIFSSSLQTAYSQGYAWCFLCFSLSHFLPGFFCSLQTWPIFQTRRPSFPPASSVWIKTLCAEVLPKSSSPINIFSTQKPYISVGSDPLHVSRLLKCCLFVEPCDRIWKRFLLTIRNWELYTSAPANRLACISRGCFMVTRQFLGDACALFNITQAQRWQQCFASEKLQTRSSCCEQRVSDNRRLGEGWRQAKPCRI